MSERLKLLDCPSEESFRTSVLKMPAFSWNTLRTRVPLTGNGATGPRLRSHEKTEVNSSGFSPVSKIAPWAAGTTSNMHSINWRSSTSSFRTELMAVLILRSAFRSRLTRRAGRGAVATLSG